MFLVVNKYPGFFPGLEYKVLILTKAKSKFQPLTIDFKKTKIQFMNFFLRLNFTTNTGIFSYGQKAGFTFDPLKVQSRQFWSGVAKKETILTGVVSDGTVGNSPPALFLSSAGLF